MAKYDELLIVFAASFAGTLTAKAVYEYLKNTGQLPNWMVGVY